jgi:hypothetical protein
MPSHLGAQHLAGGSDGRSAELKPTMLWDIPRDIVTSALLRKDLGAA